MRAFLAAPQSRPSRAAPAPCRWPPATQTLRGVGGEPREDWEQRQSKDAGRQNRGAVVEHRLDREAVQRAQHHTRSKTSPDQGLARHACADDDRAGEKQGSAHGLPLNPRHPHLEKSLTFIQTPAAPAARPTNSPMSTNTGAVCSTLSSARPPNSGSRTAPARNKPSPPRSPGVGPEPEVGAMPLRILSGARFGQEAAQEGRGDADFGLLEPVCRHRRSQDEDGYQ